MSCGNTLMAYVIGYNESSTISIKHDDNNEAYDVDPIQRSIKMKSTMHEKTDF